MYMMKPGPGGPPSLPGMPGPGVSSAAQFAKAHLGILKCESKFCAPVCEGTVCKSKFLYSRV